MLAPKQPHRNLAFDWPGCVPALVMLTFVVPTAWSVAEQPVQRARPPKFDPRQVTDVFFEDLFQVLSVPPSSSGMTAVPADPQRTAKPGEPAVAAADVGWTALVSAATLEDEVKRLKLSVDKNIGTPVDFAAQGHRAAGRDFTLLALIFGIIREYEGNVRWQADARAAQIRFAAAAAHAQAGGNAAVYQEARQRKADLQDLVGGGSLSGPSDAPQEAWGSLDRPLLMQRLEAGSQAISPRLATPAAFAAGSDALRHEAELTAAISRALTGKSMDDAEDAEYAAFALQMQHAASSLVQAVQQENYAQARQASGQLSKLCAECHAAYR